MSASGSYNVSNVSPSPPSTDSECAGLQFTRRGEASYRIKSRKGSDTVTLGGGEFNDVAFAEVTVSGTGTVTESVTNSPPGCGVPNRETPQNCERTKRTSLKVTLFGKRIGSITDPPKNILGSRCPPEVVGFQTNTPLQPR